MRLVLLFLLLPVCSTGFSQNEGPFSVSLNPKLGFLMAHRKTMHHLVQDKNKVLEVEFSRQDTSGSPWSQIYRYPIRGLSVAYQDYGYSDVLGSSVSVFKFTKFPIYQHTKWGFFDFKLGNGISYITKKYDEGQNKKNIAIGSHINGYVSLQLLWSKHWEKFYVGAGVDFSHISNASLKAPNQGLNTLTGLFSLGYNISPRRVYEGTKFPKDSLSAVRKFNKWQFHFIFGLKQNLPDHLESRTYGVGALQALYRKQLGRVWDWEFGVDVVYNEANRWFFEIDPVPIYQAFLVGGYTGLSMSLYRSQIYFGIGAYGLNLIDPAGWIYNRIGLRYFLNDHWNLAVGIKAHVGIADYLEWGLGYRF